MVGFPCLFLGIILFAYAIIGLCMELEKDPEVKEVPCYDRFGNEIQELVCEEKNYNTGKYIALVFPCGFLFAVAMILLVLEEQRI